MKKISISEINQTVVHKIENRLNHYPIPDKALYYDNHNIIIKLN